MSGPDFSALLKRPAGVAKKPPVLPVGDYAGVIGGYEFGDDNKNKTPYVRLFPKLTGWPEALDDVELKAAVDLTKRSLRKDFFFTPDAEWRLDEFLKSLGIDMAGRQYEEVIPEITGKAVVVTVGQYMNQKSNELANQVDKIIGA